ncbi:MAG: potassium channel protein [Methanophagales archaeon ANME-1-THS]|nr:MAG: potassium channel protein [Methanophagales archaeon ANME-1-THS]
MIPLILLRLLRNFAGVIKERRVLLYAGLYLGTLWLIAVLLFHLFEAYSLFDSFYWAVTTTATVGYGDIVAKTVLGKITSVIVMLSGIGVLGLIFATVTDLVIEQSLKRRRRIRTFMENHVIVCGWDKKLEVAVKELLAAGKEVVVVAEVEDIPLADKHLMVIKGEPCADEHLSRANISKASFALISGRTDTETLLSAIAVKTLNPAIHITCIVSDPRVIQALKKTGVDQTLSADEFLGLVLVRSVFVPQVSTFLNEMLDVKGMDLYQERIPAEFEGKRFLEVINLLKARYDTIPVGLVRESRVTINPDKELSLKKGDELLYIAEESLNLGAST